MWGCLKIDENVMWQCHWTATWANFYWVWFICIYTIHNSTCIIPFIEFQKFVQWLEMNESNTVGNIIAHNQIRNVYIHFCIISYPKNHPNNNKSMYRKILSRYQSPDFEFYTRNQQKFIFLLCLIFDTKVHTLIWLVL